jgi:Flp pilus assembly protein TadB
VFGRRKQDQTLPAPQQPAKAGGKNRPTPRRHQQEARNKRPLVPTDRKLAGRQAREASRAERLRARDAMMTGDERYLPPRDKGPVRRYVRDFVDARWNVGEFFLIVALVVVFLTFIQDPVVQLVGTGVLWLTVVACVVDGFLLSRKLKRRLVERFGEDQLPAGVVRYGVMRAFQLRRTRLPKPMVSRGQYPS